MCWTKTLEPVTVTLLRKVIYVYAIKDLEIKLPWITVQVGLKCHHKELCNQKAEGDETSHSQRAVWRQKEWREAATNQESLEPPGARRDMGTDSPQSLPREHSSAHTLTSNSGLQEGERTNLCLFKPPCLCRFVMAAPGDWGRWAARQKPGSLMTPWSPSTPNY